MDKSTDNVFKPHKTGKEWEEKGKKYSDLIAAEEMAKKFKRSYEGTVDGDGPDKSAER